LDNRAREFGVRAYSIHPGSIAGTELAREAPLEKFIQMGFCDEQGNILSEVASSLKSIPQGASTTIWCATSPLLNNIGGVFCEDADIAELSAGKDVSASGVKPYSLDETNARRLWELSEKLATITFKCK